MLGTVLHTFFISMLEKPSFAYFISIVFKSTYIFNTDFGEHFFLSNRNFILSLQHIFFKFLTRKVQNATKSSGEKPKLTSEKHV